MVLGLPDFLKPQLASFLSNDTSSLVSRYVDVTMKTFRQLPLLGALSGVALSASISQRQADSAPTVTIQNGTVAGVHHAAYNQDFFLGVPFAEPPLGDLRFRAPEPLKEKWNGTLQATQYYPECVVS